MPNYASVTLVGHLGRDPETKHLPSGDSVTAFSIATSRKRKDEEITTWWNCSLFGKRGEALAKYLKKGDPVLVHGEPYLRKYQGASGEGQSLDVVVSDFAFVGGKGDSGQVAPSAPVRESRPPRSGAQGASAPVNFDEEIPFDVYQRGLVV
jgi:single-strand DNA-binding protein